MAPRSSIPFDYERMYAYYTGHTPVWTRNAQIVLYSYEVKAVARAKKRHEYAQVVPFVKGNVARVGRLDALAERHPGAFPNGLFVVLAEGAFGEEERPQDVRKAAYFVFPRFRAFEETKVLVGDHFTFQLGNPADAKRLHLHFTSYLLETETTGATMHVQNHVPAAFDLPLDPKKSAGWLDAKHAERAAPLISIMGLPWSARPHVDGMEGGGRAAPSRSRARTEGHGQAEVCAPEFAALWRTKPLKSMVIIGVHSPSGGYHVTVVCKDTLSSDDDESRICAGTHFVVRGNVIRDELAIQKRVARLLQPIDFDIDTGSYSGSDSD